MSDSIQFLNKKVNRPTNNPNDNVNIYQYNPNMNFRETGKFIFLIFRKLPNQSANGNGKRTKSKDKKLFDK